MTTLLLDDLIRELVRLKGEILRHGKPPVEICMTGDGFNWTAVSPTIEDGRVVLYPNTKLRVGRPRYGNPKSAA